MLARRSYYNLVNASRKSRPLRGVQPPETVRVLSHIVAQPDVVWGLNQDQTKFPNRYRLDSMQAPD